MGWLRLKGLEGFRVSGKEAQPGEAVGLCEEKRSLST